MRIIGGELKGRKFEAPGESGKGRNKAHDIRPTADRVREAIFNVLLNGKNAAPLRGAMVADVFAGTGGLGFEALSHGAAHAVFVDKARSAVDCIRTNGAGLGVSPRLGVVEAHVQHLGAPPYPLEHGADLVFMDPPYHQDLLEPGLRHLIERGWIAASATIVAEMEADAGFHCPKGLRVMDIRLYGAAKVAFLKRA